MSAHFPAIRNETAPPFSRLSFSRQFMLLSLGILLVGMLAVGTWLQSQLERSAANRAAAIAALYVESILSGELAGRRPGRVLDAEARAALDRIFVEGPLRRKVVRFKLWAPDGSILYSSDPAQAGRRFPVDGLRTRAFTGEVQARMSALDQPDNTPERGQWSRLLEVYVPVRAAPEGEVVAVAEFYHSVANLSRDIRTAQLRGWALVALGTAAIYVLLIGLVRRANEAILSHQQALRRKLDQLRAALAENERMRDRLREAGARTTALNEQFLHRVAADLHDGPAQDAALALLRVDALTDVCRGCVPEGGGCRDLTVVRNAMTSCLDEVRAIAAGLYMPDIEPLSLGDTARRAVRDFERKSGKTVHVEVQESGDEAPLAVKITVYRLLQEALTNGWRHAQDSMQRVRVSVSHGEALLEIADDGPGFDPETAARSGRFGLAFMNERVRLLGGAFEVDTAPGRGTRIRARLPLLAADSAHD